MKQILLIAFPFMLLAASCSTTQGVLRNSGLTEAEVAAGLKEALTIGAQNSSNRLSMVDGFFRNSLHKIWLPPEARQVENTLRAVGMGATIDQAILAMNRAAEEAARSAAAIFSDAVMQMTIQDAVNVLRRGDTAATAYFREKTTQRLFTTFQPVINNALAQTKATQYWADIFRVYNTVSNTPITTDLSAYVTNRAIEALFHEMKNEEIRIRREPAARVTDLLRRVFGSTIAQQR